MRGGRLRGATVVGNETWDTAREGRGWGDGGWERDLGCGKKSGCWSEGGWEWAMATGRKATGASPADQGSAPLIWGCPAFGGLQDFLGLLSLLG